MQSTYVLKKEINIKELFFFFVIPSFIYALFATNFSLNFFEPHFLWKSYNYYFLSLLNGQLDVPAHSIGREASYLGGKVYMYYGALPLLARAFLYPFVNLEQTSVAAFSVYSFSVFGQVFLQYSLLKAFKKNSRVNSSSFKVTNYLGLTVVSLVLWFGSATFVIVQNATLYHEPYAASLCLINCFIGLLIRDGFFLKREHNVNLIPYALLAALCIHARMPSALALYCLVCFILVRHTYLSCYGNKGSNSQIRIFSFIASVVRTQYMPLLVLFIGGVSILWLNYAKFGNALSFMGSNYGYAFLEGFTERRCNLIPKSDFATVLRVIPNTAVYLTGSADLHWSLSWHLATGFGRKEFPLIPVAILWLMPLVVFLMFIVCLFKKTCFKEKKYLSVFLLLASVGALFQLSYVTIAHRYIADLWLPIALALVFMWQYFGVSKYKYINYSLLFFAVIGISYQIFISTTNKYYLKDGPIYDHVDYHYSQEDIEYLDSLTTEKIKQFHADYRANKKRACVELADKIGLKQTLESDKH